MLPQFDCNGNLPPDIFTVTIEEVLERYYCPPYKTRATLTEELKKFFEFVSQIAVCIYIDGSYITKKLAPSDVDILVILPSDFELASHDGWRLNQFRKNHRLRLDLHFKKISDGQEEIERFLNIWMTDRDGNRKGIIRVVIGEDK